MSTDNIQQMISALGASVIIVDISRVQYNEYGDLIEEDSDTTEYTTTAVVQVMTGQEEEVVAGLLKVGDLQLFFNYDDTYISYLKQNNYIKYGGVRYKIRNVITNGSEPFLKHYEIHAERA